MAATNETECMGSRCGINKDFTVRTKMTASTGPKRNVKAKLAVIAEAVSPEVAEILTSMGKKRTLSTGPKRIPKPKKILTYTLQGVLDTFSESTEYGISFRALTSEGQLAEIEKLNKGAAKGLKGLVKDTLLQHNYKQLIVEKMRNHLIASRTPQASMHHCVPRVSNNASTNHKFLSVGEWVEIDADRSPGFNSEGGIAVIVAVHDDFADVKYVSLQLSFCLQKSCGL